MLGQGQERMDSMKSWAGIEEGKAGRSVCAMNMIDSSYFSTSEYAVCQASVLKTPEALPYIVLLMPKHVENCFRYACFHTLALYVMHGKVEVWSQD